MRKNIFVNSFLENHRLRKSDPALRILQITGIITNLDGYITTYHTITKRNYTYISNITTQT